MSYKFNIATYNNSMKITKKLFFYLRLIPNRFKCQERIFSNFLSFLSLFYFLIQNLHQNGVQRGGANAPYFRIKYIYSVSKSNPPHSLPQSATKKSFVSIFSIGWRILGSYGLFQDPRIHLNNDKKYIKGFSMC